MNEADSARLLGTLERIADALERIDANLDHWMYGEQMQDEPFPPPKDADAANDTTAENDEATAADSPPFLPIHDFLDKREISIISTDKVDSSTSAIDKLALHMGNKYSHIAPVLLKIKQNMAAGTPFGLSLKKSSQEAIAAINSMCTQLRTLSLLADSRYDPSPVRYLAIRPSTSGIAQGYLSGGWLERYALQAVLAARQHAETRLRERILLEFVLGAKVTLPNGDQGELDLLFHVGDKVFWVEAKSGDHGGYLEKYSALRRRLALPPTQALVVLSDVDAETAAFLCDVHKLTILPIRDFAAHVRDLILESVGLEVETDEA